MKYFSALFAGIMLFALAGCDTASDVFRDDLNVLGTSAEIVIVGLSPEAANNAARAVEKNLEQIDQIGYTFDSASELHKLNEAISQGKSIAVSAELMSLIEKAITLYTSSNGLFNPAAGELTAMWEYHCDKADCPESPYPDEVWHLIQEKEAELISRRPAMSDLIIDGNTVSSRNRAVKLEFGDLIRGFALEKALALLKELGIENSMVYIGSGAGTLGSRGGQPWWIGFPLLPGDEHIAGTINSSGEEAAVTVRAFEKSVGRNDAIYRHVVDPRTGLPVKAIKSVTVIHSSATTANAAAVALLINGIDGWESIASRMGIRSIMMIDRDHTIYTTPGMDERINWTQDVVHKSLLP